MSNENDNIVNAYFEVNKCDQFHLYESSAIELLKNLRDLKSANLHLNSIQALFCAIQSKNVDLADQVVKFVEEESDIYKTYNNVQKKLYDKHKLSLFKLKKNK